MTLPLVTIHTVGDELVPFWHELIYADKATVTGKGKLTQIPVFRYGHCNFTVQEMLSAFGLLVLQVTGREPEGIADLFNAEKVKRDFAQAMKSENSGDQMVGEIR